MRSERIQLSLLSLLQVRITKSIRNEHKKQLFYALYIRRNFG